MKYIYALISHSDDEHNIYKIKKTMSSIYYDHNKFMAILEVLGAYLNKIKKIIP